MNIRIVTQTACMKSYIPMHKQTTKTPNLTHPDPEHSGSSLSLKREGMRESFYLYKKTNWMFILYSYYPKIAYSFISIRAVKRLCCSR